MGGTKNTLKKGIIVDLAKDGEEALKMFAASAEGFYDDIFMDIHMPKMNGLEATLLIHQMDRDDAASIPIIALSANAYEEDRCECLAAGMNDHVAKPIEQSVLFETFRSALLNIKNDI